MAILAPASAPHLSKLELFLRTTPSDTEEAPWMVMGDLQVRDIDLLKPILRLHIEQQQLPWYLASYLKISMRRPESDELLDVAPDLLVAEAADQLRTSWNIAAEGKPPEFVLEVASGRSWTRDTKEKPDIYGAMSVTEFAICAPERRRGPQLFGYHRNASGQFVDWRPDNRGVLWSRTLSLGLYVEQRLWLRAVDQEGRRLPAPHESLAVEQAARREAERRAAEEVVSRQAEAQARANAEAEVARLQEELRQLRADLGKMEER
jgi:Uma2 family endonuclease